MYLRSAQFESIFGRTIMERKGILGRSYDHYYTEND